MVFEEAGTYTIEYTATDDCGNTTTEDRTVIVESPNTWADATDEKIVEMVAAADRGEINLADFWSVGDERVVHLSAMEAMSPLTDTHVAQDVTLVLMNVGGKTLNSPTESGRNECSFIVGMKNSLKESGYLNSTGTNSGGWENCDRRAWCNSVFYNSIPSSLRPIFKQVKNKTANGGNDATASVESIDYFALPAEYEVSGSYTRSSQVYESDLQQFEYYQTVANRIKRMGGSGGSPSIWFERSPAAGRSDIYCSVSATGTDSGSSPSNNNGISPFGCI